jgi:hypothetical protein
LSGAASLSPGAFRAEISAEPCERNGYCFNLVPSEAWALPNPIVPNFMSEAIRHQDPESLRLHSAPEHLHEWKRWGGYLSERQWGTVREDYSPNGNCWDYFPHDHARSRAYRWGEDGLLGLTDRQCRVCFGLALWNGRDPILKERLFGLTNAQGNHGEDVKEAYFYLRNTPTHSYMKGLYKYPQRAFPYAQLVAENAAAGVHRPEVELADLGLFDEGRYFDVVAEYAKAGPEDILIQISVTNHGPDPARLHLLPQLWFRNVWSWQGRHLTGDTKPQLMVDSPDRWSFHRETLGDYFFDFEPNDPRRQEFIFTENKTNYERLFKAPNRSATVKDGFHEYLIGGQESAISREGGLTKGAAVYVLDLQPGETQCVRLRLHKGTVPLPDAFAEFESVLQARRAECEAYYAASLPVGLDVEQREICLQAYAGLLWNKQFYYYSVDDWYPGDPGRPLDLKEAAYRPNMAWRHMFARDVISMPDSWEYPWFAAWDLAFHTVSLAEIDAEFAKKQIELLLRDNYLNPNGQIPAYEFQLDAVNPPVHAWAALRVYHIAAEQSGKKDRVFLARIFQKLLLNYTWWVNQTDEEGDNLFTGGFLGLDNIGVFDRGATLPTEGRLQQADATAWMAFYCLGMMRMALELALHGGELQASHEEMAAKFLAHFVQISEAMHSHGGTGLWHELDGFYYDHIRSHDKTLALKTRSLVGLLPLIAVESISEAELAALPDFRERFEWQLSQRPFLSKCLMVSHDESGQPRRLLSLVSFERLARVLRAMFDEQEFLSPHGIRSLSLHHRDNPCRVTLEGRDFEVRYTPGESDTDIFGGNSNWRGPVWFPINHLLIESLEKYQAYLPDAFQLEYPTHSGQYCSLPVIIRDLKLRHISLFRRGPGGRRPCHGIDRRFASDPAWQDLMLFHEFFHGDTGKGLGASHQTGWTALVTSMLRDVANA